MNGMQDALLVAGPGGGPSVGGGLGCCVGWGWCSLWVFLVWVLIFQGFLNLGG
jgi:hypothetical protein